MDRMIISFAAILGSAGVLSAADVPESWVNACTIATADVNARDAATVAAGVTVEKYNKWLWSPQVGGAKGVLVIHPPARETAASLEINLQGKHLDRTKNVRITARGSQFEPGVTLRVVAGAKVLRETVLGKSWETVNLAISELPKDARSLSFTFSPIGWKFEYCYVDEIVTDATPLAGAIDGYRMWNKLEGGKPLEAVAVGKQPDGSEVSLMTRDGKVYPVKTELLVRADQEIVKKWRKSASTPLFQENNTSGNPIPATGGIVLTQPSLMQQAQGGFGRQIDELGTIFTDFAAVENDLAAHPEVVIYNGQTPGEGLSGECRITYLMPRATAESLLVKRAGAVAKFKAVSPGFPPGLSFYNYDIKMGPYNHMTLMTDVADQVVALQFKARNKAVPVQPPYLREGIVGTRDFVDVAWGGSNSYQLKGSGNQFMLNILSPAETNLCYLPRPLVKQILFNVREKRKQRK